MRDAFRSGDMWLDQSRRYGDLKQVLVPAQVAATNARLAVPLDPEEWLADRHAQMELGLEKLSAAAKAGTIPGGSVDGGILKLSRLTASPPAGADDLIFDLYKRIPDARVTDIMLDVDNVVGFSDAFTHLRTGAPPKDRIGLMNVLLAEGLNLGLTKMANASNSHGFWELMRISRWHVESEAYNRALAAVVEAQADLPMAHFWGLGMTASSDGQFFPTTRQAEAMNLINAKYRRTPGLSTNDNIHRSTPQAAIEGGNVVPDRCAIQGLVFHPRHEGGRSICFPLDVTNSAISTARQVMLASPRGGTCDGEAEVDSACSGAERQAVQACVCLLRSVVGGR